jgi:hypothetical protein
VRAATVKDTFAPAAGGAACTHTLQCAGTGEK